MARANATNRRKLAIACPTPSRFNRPVEAIPRPRPHMTFSLTSGNNAAPSRSNTTRRSEFEPTSMTPIRSAAWSASRSDIGSIGDKSGMTPPQRLAAPRQARIGHEIAMGGKRFLVGRYPPVLSGERQAPTLQAVTQVRHHDLVEHLAVHRGIFNRHQRLDAPVEIARHPV